MYWIS
ncbi:hypothetical protein V2J09_016470 [Rumex salicifolius]